jgi:hypothetical protein
MPRRYPSHRPEAYLDPDAAAPDGRIYVEVTGTAMPEVIDAE